jgi:hypothetical protein
MYLIMHAKLVESDSFEEKQFYKKMCPIKYDK